MWRSPEGWIPLKMRGTGGTGAKAIRKTDATQLLSAAQLAATKAAAWLREQEGRMPPDQWAAKGKADFVTQVDRRSEEIIGEALLGAFPDSTVMGEELSPD